MNEVEICNKKKQLAEMVEMYKCTINELHKLAKLINYDVENLDYQKIDIDINKKNISFTNFEDYVKQCLIIIILRLIFFYIYLSAYSVKFILLIHSVIFKFEHLIHLLSYYSGSRCYSSSNNSQ